ncbi:GmrSD restriction endonuclease domain-containing protein [Actinopolyspora sp. H202]|uniref:GmrSD restriction endonuclease domain-containing protein n=1 Tax=Actinopolyspora sp. H202 TaxID=1500456 RepID=UPI003EE60C5A
MPTLSTLLYQIDSGSVLLPEFQRGYVWNRDQVRELMQSLYRGHPVGGLLMWETDAEGVSVRGETSGQQGTHLLLLDGQQRITSLYGVVRGKAPAFFEGDPAVFANLYFNVVEEKFEFYAPSRMADDYRWVNVTKLFLENLGEYITSFQQHDPANLGLYVERLNRLRNLLEREFYAEKITGNDKNVDTVVDIFNRVNSGGTKLSKGDLALAKICSQWSDARGEMREKLQEWQEADFDFTLDWLLRNANAVATGRALFTALDNVSAGEFRDALYRSTGYIGRFLDLVSGRLGLDHDRVLMARYAFPVVSRLLELNGGRFDDRSHQDKVLYWYVHAALWGRFAGSTETFLQKDYETVERSGIDGLITSLERWRGGNLDVHAHDFEGSTKGSRFYPLLYMLTRVNQARDFGSGVPLRADMLGRNSSLQVHHLFPKSLLYQAGYERSQVNAIANFCFLTQDTNLVVGNRSPAEYFAEVEEKHPGVLASQWIPTDPELWKIERYPDFLQARRELLAEAAQSFLTELRTGETATDREELQPLSIAGDDDMDARVAQVNGLISELVELGCTPPSTDTEIADPRTGRALAVAEAFWPEGLQTGQGSPVVLELDTADADLPRLEELGYEVFTSVDALRGYVRRRNRSEPESEPDPDAGSVAAERSREPDPAAEPVVAEFEQRMRSLYERGRKEAHYTATYFLSMLAEHGGLSTAHKLLAGGGVSDGFAALWERGRLDLTVEALATESRFAELFSAEELRTAEHRLSQFGYAT